MPLGRRGHARVVVLTVIEEELDAVKVALGAVHEIGATATYSPVPHPGPDPSLPFVVARCANRSNIPAQNAAAELLEAWRPEVLVLAGIGGGINRPQGGPKKVTWSGPSPGDVVVAEYVHYAEFTKNVPAESHLRYFPLDQPTSGLVQAHGDPLRYAVEDAQWHKAIKATRPTKGKPRVEVGEIIAVEGLAGDPENDHQKTYLRRFDHAAAIDMESVGVARALHAVRTDVHYNPRWLCLRVISDKVYAPVDEGWKLAVPKDNDAERKQWKDYATAVLGATTRCVVERLLIEPRGAVPADGGAAAFTTWPP